MTTSVPGISFNPATGFSAPLESQILAGAQADINTAFGGNANQQLTTPQGQIASSEASILADANAQILALFNGVDPAYSSGRMQDAIGRIYYMSRIAASSTVVTATCSGATGTVIPAGALAIDQGGNVYVSLALARIPVGGSVSVTFAAQNTGPLACPPGYLNQIYQAIPGWDSVTNPSDGDIGRLVESRADFEYRRQQSVAANAQGSLQAIAGAVWGVSGVLDVYVIENPTNATAGAAFTASISGTTMTVSAVGSGTVNVGDMLIGAGLVSGSKIIAQGTGTGGTGTYTIAPAQTVSSESMQSAQAGLMLPANSIYIAAYGGSSAAIAQAIFTKKSAGCSMSGNTSVTVSDTQSGYVYPYPTYSITYNIPTPTPILFSVTIQNNSGVPSNAVALVQDAITAAFIGSDGGPRARIGSALFASRFYAGIVALGSWAQIYSLELGIDAANLSTVQLRGDQVPTISASNISVALAP